MTDFITKVQYDELENLEMLGDTDEFNELLKKYAGITARPYTAYLYYDTTGDYVGDSNVNNLDELLRTAYVEVRDG